LDVGLVVKAVKVIESGRARDPAELVKALRISLPDAAELIEAIVDAKKLQQISVAEAERRRCGRCERLGSAGLSFGTRV